MKNKQIKNIVITSGASCPDSLMELLIKKIANIFKEEIEEQTIYNQILKNYKKGLTIS